ncbi:MAG: transposase, partial [Chloroflexota bacterium]
SRKIQPAKSALYDPAFGNDLKPIDKPPLIHWCEQVFGVQVEISRRLGNGFQVIPKRWIVERTFGWLNFARRLSKDYEVRPDVSESMIYVAMIHLMLKRLHPT